MMRIFANIGFITNSSSVVVHFPKQILENKKVKTFMEKYEIKNGYVGSYMWNRSECESFLKDPEDFSAARENFAQEDYSDIGCYGPALDENQVAIIYGDEYDGITQQFCDVLKHAAEEMKLSTSSQGYN